MSAEIHPDARFLRGFRPSPLKLYFPTLFLLLTGLSPASVNAALEANIAPENIADKILTPNRGITELRIWAHAGPEAELDHAKVVVKNAKGVVVGHGRTSPHGTLSVKFRNSKAKLPLQIFVQGGTEQGERFRGHLTALVDQVSDLKQPVHVDLLSSTARKLSKRLSDYAPAMTSVRHTLRIGKGAPDWILRVKNNHVDYSRFKAAQEVRGGFDQYVAWLAKRAKSGQTVTELEPLPVKIQTTATTPTGSKASIVANALNPDRASTALVATATTSASTPPLGSSAPTCTAAMGTAPSSTTGASTNAIDDFGSMGIGFLGKYAGVPTAVTSSVTGMLFSNGSSSTNGPATQAITSVVTELNCISQQIGYLSEQVAELTYQVDVQAATQCNNAVQTNYNNYQHLINNSSSDPLTSANTSLTADIASWGELSNTCGSAINDALFGTSGGQGSALQGLLGVTWNSWMTQGQVQQVQQFLSYWSTVEYEQFILQSEYFNWNSQQENALALAGVGGTDQNGNNYCSAGTTGTTSTMCAWASNISNAFPPDIYSDEVAIMANGIAVNGYPAGLAQAGICNGCWTEGTLYGGGGTSTNNYGALGFTASLVGDHAMSYKNGVYAYFDFSDPSSSTAGLATTAQNLFNAAPLNTTANSVVEGYSTNRITNHFTIDASVLASVNGVNSNGVWGVANGSENTALGKTNNNGYWYLQQWLVNLLAEDENGQNYFTQTALYNAGFGGVSSVYFGTYDSYFQIGNPNNGYSSMSYNRLGVWGDYSSQIFAPYNGVWSNPGNYFSQSIYCASNAPPDCPTTGQYAGSGGEEATAPPVMAVLLGRNWWPANSGSTPASPGAAGLQNYSPPTPYFLFAGSAPTLSSTLAFSSTSVQLTFTAPQATSGYTITGYVGTCSGTNSSGAIVSGTVNGTASPLTVSNLQDGLSYQCTVQAQYSNGAGTVITSVYSNSVTASTAVPTAPTINSISSPAAGELQINFTPSSSNGGSAITNYVTACAASGYSTGYAGGTTSPALVQNLTGGVAYTCNMVAQNVNGYSPSSNLVVATPSQ